MMKPLKTKQMLAIFLLFLLLSPCPATAFEGALTNEAYIKKLINTIREDPLKYADSCKFERAELLNDLPWLEENLKEGFPPLEVDEILSLRADAHNFPEKADGAEKIEQTPVPLESDYLSVGETGGVVSFFNFMNSRSAIDILVGNLFKGELDPKRSKPRYILSSAFDRIGASLKAGYLESSRQMAYYITLTFASSSVLRSEIQILHVVNQIRKDPTTIFLYMGHDAFHKSILTPFYEGYAHCEETYPPLFSHPVLGESAREYDYRPTTDLDEEFTPLDRAVALGYEGIGVEELLLRSWYTEGAEVSPVRQIIEGWLVNELGTSPASRNCLFSRDVNEAGVGLRFSYREETVVADLAIVMGQAVYEEGKQPRVYGVVYSDDDNNGIYTPGEEIQGHRVCIYNDGGISDNNDENHGDEVYVEPVFSDNTGYFSLTLPVGKYIFETSEENGNLKRIHHQITGDEFLTFDISSADLNSPEEQ